MFAKKDIIRGSILAGITIIFYNILAFVIPFAHTGTFWISYIFTWIALIVGFGSIVYSLSNGADGKNWFYGFPIAKAGTVYLATQLAIGFVGMTLAKLMLTWVWLIVSVIPLVVAVFCIVSADSTRDEIKRMDEKLAEDVQNMRALQSKSASLSALCDNNDVAAELVKLAEKFKYSDPVSSEATKKLELDLEQILSEIEAAIACNSLDNISTLCKKATTTLSERNRICKLHKGK